MAGAYFALGDWPHTEEQRRHVLSEFQELYRLRPDNESFLYGLANAYHRMANLEEQTKHYAEAKANVLEAIRCSTCRRSAIRRISVSAWTGLSRSSVWGAF